MTKNELSYHPDTYWTKVALKIRQRGSENYIAGDDEPYYRYKRNQFLKLLAEIDFSGKRVLEVGCGPGGNLAEIIKYKPLRLTGVDISQEMINLATRNLEGKNVEIVKVDGQSLPFESKSMDIVLTATVLQHNTDMQMLNHLIAEICRLSADKVILFERIEKKTKSIESCEGRPLLFYKEMLIKNGFELLEVKYLPISVSYYVSGIIRRFFNFRKRNEGEQLSSFSIILQRLSLPVTRLLDKIHTEKRDVARMTFGLIKE